MLIMVSAHGCPFKAATVFFEYRETIQSLVQHRNADTRATAPVGSFRPGPARVAGRSARARRNRAFHNPPRRWRLASFAGLADTSPPHGRAPDARPDTLPARWYFLIAQAALRRPPCYVRQAASIAPWQGGDTAERANRIPGANPHGQLNHSE